MPPQSKKGFTLMELMIVIAIIGVLAAALFPRLTDYQARGRDTKRWVDVRAIQVALEMHYNDSGAYPQSNLYSGNQEPHTAWSNSSHSGSWQSLANQLQ
jgi:type II secretion system protein G